MFLIEQKSTTAAKQAQRIEQQEASERVPNTHTHNTVTPAEERDSRQAQLTTSRCIAGVRCAP